MKEPKVSVETPSGEKRVSIEDFLYNDRKIWIEGTITPELVNSILMQLMILEEHVREQNVDPNTVEVTFYITGPGGSINAGLNLYSAMVNSELKIKTVAVGTCASMSAILFLAGEKREMLPHGRLIYHEPCSGRLEELGERKLSHLKEVVECLEVYHKRIVGIIAKRTGQDADKVDSLIKPTDFCLTAEEAYQFGAATKLIRKL